MEDGSLPSASESNPFAATATAEAAVVLQNPYAKKRPKLETTTTTKTPTTEKPMTSRELLLQHLQLPPEEEEVDVAGGVDNQEGGDKDESSSSCCLETQPKDTLQSLPCQSTTTLFDSNAPQWQNSSRPSVSQQLSFGSAEILTISEYLQHCEIFYREKKSVRLTGRLTHRIVHSSTMVSFVLSDPLESLKPKARTTVKRTTATVATTQNPNAMSKDTRLSAGSSTAGTRSHVRPQRPPSLGGRPSNISSNNTTKRSALLSSSATTTTSHRLVYKKTPGGLRTPVAAAKTTSAAGIISNTSRLKDPPVPQQQQRQQNPVETLVQALMATSSSEKCNIDKSNSCTAAVWIIAHPQHVMVQECVVGDLVMILGEVGCLDNNNNNNNQNGDDVTLKPFPSANGFEKEDATVLEQVRMATIAQQQQQQYYVAARICRNANGTDMSLFTQALMTRRKFLRAIGNDTTSTTASVITSNDGVDDEAGKRSLLRPGWGPPQPTTK